MAKKVSIKRKTLAARFNYYGSPAVNVKYYLTNDPEIKNAITRGIQIPQAGVEISSTFNLSTATAPLTDAQLKNAFLTLCDKDGFKIYDNLVLYTFLAAANNGEIRNFMNAKIDPSKSYIKFTDVTGLNASTSYLLIEFLITVPNN